MAGSHAPGLVDIAVATTTDVGIERATLLIDGQERASLDTVPVSFSHWFTVQGTYRVEVRVQDSCGGEVTSPPVLLAIDSSAPPCASDNEPPDLAITWPADGDTLAHGLQRIRVSETDLVGTAFVSFEVDGVPMVDSVDLSAPFSYLWDAPMGTHTVRALAEDACGNAGASAAVTLTMYNSAPLPLPDAALTEPGVAVTIDVLVNDSDPEGDPIRFAVTTPFPVPPQHGSVVVQGDSVVYTPEPGFGVGGRAHDEFFYRIIDDQGGFRATRVKVTVDEFP